MSARFHPYLRGCTMVEWVITMGHMRKRNQISRAAHIAKDVWIGENVVIEDDVLIGANAVILEEVTVGHHSVIGAGAVVTKDVEPYSVMAGVPAKKIKENHAGSFMEPALRHHE